MIEDYYLAKNYNVPFAQDLETVSAWKADCFFIIDSELNNIKLHKEKLNGS